MVMWTKGFNFRATQGWATDAANETSVLETAYLYPQVRNGVTFGFESTITGFRDRGAGGLDRRLAGCVLVPPTAGVPVDFRIDLPVTGALYTYTFRLAHGDTEPHLNSQSWALLDTTSVLANQTDADGHADLQWNDATGATYTHLTWPGGNVAITRTFTTLIARVRIDAASNEGSGLAHVFLEVDLGDIIQVVDTVAVQDRRRVPV